MDKEITHRIGRETELPEQSEIVTNKLMSVVKDHDLNTILGNYIGTRIVPSLLRDMTISEEQAIRISSAYGETLDQLAEELFTPEELSTFRDTSAALALKSVPHVR